MLISAFSFFCLNGFSLSLGLGDIEGIQVGPGKEADQPTIWNGLAHAVNGGRLCVGGGRVFHGFSHRGLDVVDEALGHTVLRVEHRHTQVNTGGELQVVQIPTLCLQHLANPENIGLIRTLKNVLWFMQFSMHVFRI